MGKGADYGMKFKEFMDKMHVIHLISGRSPNGERPKMRQHNQIALSAFYYNDPITTADDAQGSKIIANIN